MDDGPCEYWSDEEVSAYHEGQDSRNAELAALQAKLAESEARVAMLLGTLDKLTGMFAPYGICEPVEGFAKRPQDLQGCIKQALATQPPSDLVATEITNCLLVESKRGPLVESKGLTTVLRDLAIMDRAAFDDLVALVRFVKRLDDDRRNALDPDYGNSLNYDDVDDVREMAVELIDTLLTNQPGFRALMENNHES